MNFFKSLLSLILLIVLASCNSGEQPNASTPLKATDAISGPKDLPNHKKYRDFIKEFARLQQERENAFQEFYDDVHSGAFPEKKNVVEINEKELDTFLNNLEKRV